MIGLLRTRGFSSRNWQTLLTDNTLNAALLIGVMYMALMFFGAEIRAKNLSTLPIRSSESTAPKLRNTTITNRVMRSRTGELYLLAQGKLVRMQRPEGDIWRTVASNVTASAFDPQNEKIIYITNGSGIQKSVDGGERWISLDNGLPASRIKFISINPVTTTEVFVGSDAGLYVTTDAGFSWRATTLRSPVNQFYIDHTLPTTRYALIDNGSMLVSKDGGLNWEKSEAGIPVEIVRTPGKPPRQVRVRVRHLFFINRAEPFLLADTDGHGVFRSDDRGNSWKSSQKGLKLSDQYRSIYVDDAEIIIAGSNIARSADGVNWQAIPVKSNHYSVGEFSGLAPHPSVGGYVIVFRNFQQSPDTDRIGYLTPDGTLVGLNYGLLPRSTVRVIWTGQVNNRLALFATLYNWGPSDRDYRDHDPSHSGNYSIYEDGTYLSVDDGVSWDYLFSSSCGITVAVRPGSPNDAWMFGRDGACLLRAQAGGLSWVLAANARFSFANDAVSKIVFDRTDTSLLYYIAGVNEGELYRYKYNAVRNEGEVVALNIKAADILIREDSPKMMFTDRGQFTSDGGWTWVDKAGAFSKYIDPLYGHRFRRTDISLLSFRGSELRMALHAYDSYMHRGGGYILASSDLGDSWRVIRAFDGQELQRVFVDTNDSTNMFAVLRTFNRRQFSVQGDMIKVLESRDAGSTWQERYSYKLTESDRMYHHEREIVQTVTQYRQGTSRSILVGGWVGLWRSSDDGRTWARLGGVLSGGASKETTVPTADVIGSGPGLSLKPVVPTDSLPSSGEGDGQLGLRYYDSGEYLEAYQHFSSAVSNGREIRIPIKHRHSGPGLGLDDDLCLGELIISKEFLEFRGKSTGSESRELNFKWHDFKVPLRQIYEIKLEPQKEGRFELKFRILKGNKEDKKSYNFYPATATLKNESTTSRYWKVRCSDCIGKSELIAKLLENLINSKPAGSHPQ